MLQQFEKLLSQLSEKYPKIFLIAHSGKSADFNVLENKYEEFDYPHNVILVDSLVIFGQKERKKNPKRVVSRSVDSLLRVFQIPRTEIHCGMLN